MKRKTRYILIGVASVAAAFIGFGVLSSGGVFDYDVWQRESPLVSPIAVTRVQDGALTLADGRTFRPAGVRRADGVSGAEYDRALRTIGTQGVIVVRDTGDGSAFLLAEPKFYNWCGYRSGWERWAGSYLQCPMSELLIQTAYAIPVLDQVGLTPRERWRLEGVEHIVGVDDSPTRIEDSLSAFRYSTRESYLTDYEANLGRIWKAPPQ